MFNGLFDFVRNSWNKAKDAWNSVADAASRIIENVVNAIIESIFGWLTSSVDMIIDLLKKYYNKEKIYLVIVNETSAIVTGNQFDTNFNIASSSGENIKGKNVTEEMNERFAAATRKNNMSKHTSRKALDFREVYEIEMD
jgi:kynureninase